MNLKCIMQCERSQSQKAAFYENNKTRQSVVARGWGRERELQMDTQKLLGLMEMSCLDIA